MLIQKTDETPDEGHHITVARLHSLFCIICVMSNESKQASTGTYDERLKYYSHL